MKTRILSSIIAIIILFLFLFYLPAKFFYLFIFAIVTISLAELHRILFKKLTFYYYFSLFFTMLLYLSIIILNKNIFFELFSLLFIIICTYLIFKFEIFKQEIINLSKFLFSILYISMISMYAIFIHKFSNGKLYILHFLIICWATDSLAYIIGSKFGKNKLCPMVSPNKTIEGFLGGVAGGIIAGFAGILFLKLSILKVLFISIFTPLACVAGDLFESLLKRKFNVKDSGTFLPGHGGILDRIDGILFAIPVYYLSINF